MSESLFYDAQDVLNERKRQTAAKMVSLKSLPLRGFIRCSNCHKMLTGSSSKGKYHHYYYYHCDSMCGVRHNAVNTNVKFLEKLQEWVINPAAVELFRMVVTSAYKSRTKTQFNAKAEVLNDLTKQNEKMAKARRLLVEEEIDSADYKLIKVDCEAIITHLEAKLQDISEQKIMRVDIDKVVDKIIESYSKKLSKNE